mgnify:FL=1
MKMLRKGFTMVELLVAMGIIIILAALLLPFISTARESSRLVQCQNNQRQIYSVFLTKKDTLGTRLRPENLRGHFEKELGETPEVYHCPNAAKIVAMRSQRSVLSVSPVITTLNSFGFNSRVSRLNGERDGQKIFSLDYRAVTANVVGPEAPVEEFVQLVAPRHTGQCNVLFFDGHVETRDPRLPTIDALAIDPRYCWVHEKHWRPFTDIGLQRTEGNCLSQNPRVAQAPPRQDEEIPEVALLYPEIENENDDEETDVPEMRIPEETGNAPPTLVYITNATNYLPENTNTTYRIKMGDIHIFDDDEGENTITLSGPDVNDFEFEGTVLYLKAGVLLDYERKRAHRVTVDVVDDSFEEGHDLVQITYSLNLIDR